METVKIKIEFDGWRCLSKKQQLEILQLSRSKFVNSNFSDNGLLVEAKEEYDAFHFCYLAIIQYRESLNNWDGYSVSKLSKKIILNFADRKRKLKFEYFKRLIKENSLDDAKFILAGNLYLYPDDTVEILSDVQREMNNTFRHMNDDELLKAYHIILMKAAERERKF
jgi:hypothetical protein